jgi:hypothetical protein
MVLVISSQDLSQLSPKNPSIHPALHFLEFVSQFGIPMVAIVDVIRLRVIVLDVPRISMVISVRKNVALIVR